MFTERAQNLIDQAQEDALSKGKKFLDSWSLVAALGSDSEGSVRLAECLTQGDVDKLRSIAPELESFSDKKDSLEFDELLRSIIKTAYELASVDGVPDRMHPGFINVQHLSCAVAMSEKACKDLFDGLPPLGKERALKLLSDWSAIKEIDGSIGSLVNTLRDMRYRLLENIFGQDHAVHAFIEGLYNAEITASIDTERRKPSAVFVFAGPPGVGKTYMAELSSSFLGRPFKRFDMTGYSDHQMHNQLVGFARSYQGAHPGLLTDFVAKNPTAILLFDEIEKAHLNTIQLFYQILDAGRLEDKFNEEEVSFRDTIIIFTTNAGSSLYDNPNRAGIGVADTGYHSRTILSALEQEKNPTTGQPVFPPAICSRLGQGYPVMFNYLGINELIRISNAELNRTSNLLEKKYLKRFTFDSLLPISLVFRAGGQADARELCAETEKFVKNELFKFGALYSAERANDAFDEFDRVHFALEMEANTVHQSVRELYAMVEKPKILLIAGEKFARLCREHVPEVQWYFAGTKEETVAILASHEVDLILLDLWLPDVELEEGTTGENNLNLGKTLSQDLDYTPLSARALTRGREILRKIHDSYPDNPVYLLSFESEISSHPQEGVRTATLVMDASKSWDEVSLSDVSEISPELSVDEELFLACVRSGGARGLIDTDFKDDQHAEWSDRRDRFASQLISIAERVYREAKAHWLARQRKVLSFETAVDLDRPGKLLTIRLRDFRLSRAVEASDASEMVDDVQRPVTRFDDVIGAAAAKKSLGFVVDWLNKPGYFSTLGVRPPKGVLLTGPPGTGKTMLARAVAGESDCSFLEKSATSFVTIWQGSGPQNVRDLFARARRYAPAIVFIDEIDAIGVSRMGGAGGGRAAEETLNALLTEMEGFTEDRHRPVIVLAATNLAERLDPALRRRFDRIIEVERPDRDARLAFLNKMLPEGKSNVVSRETIKRLAGQAAGMVLADLERVIQEAAVSAAQANKNLDNAILEEAFEKMRMGEAKKTLNQDTLKRVAYHEAGHTLIAWLGGNLPVQVTVVGRGGSAGYMEMAYDEDQAIMTKPEIEQRIRETMGGRASELHFYGAEAGLSSGVAGDLKQATAWALRMVREYGMDENFGYLSLADQFSTSHNGGPLAERAALAAEAIVKRELEKACLAIKNNSIKLERLVEVLVEKNRLVKEEIEEILKES